MLQMLEACRVKRIKQLWNNFAHHVRMCSLECMIRAAIAIHKLNDDMWAGLARCLWSAIRVNACRSGGYAWKGQGVESDLTATCACGHGFLPRECIGAFSPNS